MQVAVLHSKITNVLLHSKVTDQMESCRDLIDFHTWLHTLSVWMIFYLVEGLQKSVQKHFHPKRKLFIKFLIMALLADVTHVAEKLG